MMSNINTTSSGDEPYHVFPNHPYQNLLIVAYPLLILCFLGAGIWHALNEKGLHRSLQSARRKSNLRFLYVLMFYKIFLYVLPSCMIISSIVITATGDDDNPGLLQVAAIYEVVLNGYLLFCCGTRSHNNNREPPQEDITSSISNNNNKILRFGRRLLFIALGVICGAAFASNQLDEIDYYGPVRVTNLEIFAHRPEQTIQEDNPSYYYYYTLQETLEWGGGWGCPASFEESTWCKYSHLLDEKDYGSSSSDCKRRITCQGKPPSYGMGECANSEQIQEAFDFLIRCTTDALSSTSSSGSLIPDDTDILTLQAMMNGMGVADSSTTYFEQTKAPWLDDDFNYKKKTAWRTAAVNCGECKVVASILPKDLKKVAHTTWLVGCFMVVTAVILLCCGNGIPQKYVAGTQEESSLELHTIA